MKHGEAPCILALVAPRVLSPETPSKSQETTSKEACEGGLRLGHVQHPCPVSSTDNVKTEQFWDLYGLSVGTGGTSG
jgi:hypothetical protein